MAELVVDRDEVRLASAGRERRRPAGSSPLSVAGGLLAGEIPPGWRVYGYLSFELAHLLHGAGRRPSTGHALAHLIVPEVEVHWTAEGVAIASRTEIGAELASDLLNSRREPPELAARPVVVALEGRECFMRQVAEVQRLIELGTVRKTVISRPVGVPFAVDLVGSYLLGLEVHTPARSFLLRLGDRSVGGFSPEVVVTVQAGRTVVSNPLAGTRPRTGDPKQDARLGEELRWDVKECYEHLISTRLAYEELVSVCDGDSVAIRDFMRVEERASVQHLGSTVSGRLRAGVSMWQAAEALFPPVTVSGVPKLAALNAIAALEQAERGLYGGAVCMADSAGNLDAALVLRAFMQEGGGCRLHAGAGVVSQSSPEREYEETCHKLRSVAGCMVAQSPPAGDRLLRRRAEIEER